MKTYFDINLPSIPGRVIKFKIQDIKNRAFSIQAPRFKDNKVELTKKFIQSFANFHQTPLTTDTSETITSLPKSIPKPPQFRMFISDEKKGLVTLMENIQKQPNVNNNHSKGYTFNKSIDNRQPIQPALVQQYPVTENYYFNQQSTQIPSQPISSKCKPSAIFKNQSRTKYYSRLDRSLAPAVGTYNPYSNTKSKKSEIKKKKQEINQAINYKNFKEIIRKIMVKDNQIEEEEIEQPKDLKNQHMFILDDRDRFGEQIYPIANKLKVPGPGAYEVVDSIEVQAKKVTVVEQQRKLLKQWFNN